MASFYPNARILVIPDSYQSVFFIGDSDTLAYVSLPACEGFDTRGYAFEDLLWCPSKPVTWIVVEGSAAHRLLTEQGVDRIVFREEYCAYAAETDGKLVFDPQAFAEAVPAMTAAPDRPAPQQSPFAGLSVPQISAEALRSAPQLYPYLNGRHWGLADGRGGHVRVPETADAFWVHTTVPVMTHGRPDADMVYESWTIYFSNRTVRLRRPDRFIGAMEGWWTEDGHFYGMADAEDAGIGPENAVHAASYYVHNAGDEPDLVRCVVPGAYSMPARPGPRERFTCPMTTVIGYTVLYDVSGTIPFYSSSETAGFVSYSDSYNRMVAMLSGESGSLYLAAASEDGTGYGELRDASGRRRFFWFPIRSGFMSDRTFLDVPAQDLAAMSRFRGGSAVIYNRDGKAGLAAVHGNVLLPMTYDAVLNYEDCAVLMVATEAEQQRYMSLKALYERGESLYVDGEMDGSAYDQAGLCKLDWAMEPGFGICSPDTEPFRYLDEGASFLYVKRTGEIIPLDGAL